MRRCPHCNVPLTSDEERGANCPACGGSLSTGITTKESWVRESRPEPLPVDDYHETYRDTRPSPGGSSLLGWASVRTSFTIFVTGWLLIQGAVFLSLLVEGAARRMAPPVQGDPLFILLNLIGLAVIAGSVHFLTGMCMALIVPSESSAKGWGIGIVVSLLLSLGALLIVTGSFRGGNPNVARALGYLFLGGLFVAKMLYTGFVFGVARHFRFRGVAVTLLVYLALELVLFTWIFIRSIQNEPFGRVEPFENVFGGPGTPESRWIVIVVSSVMCAWFISMVLVVRGAITRSLLRR